jgi:4-amino-4-deoxy-L-arabinose transferase-like glycosyltransferase
LISSKLQPPVIKRLESPAMSHALKLYLFPILVLFAVTLPHLEQGEFRRDTVVYAAVGRYMWDGGSLLTPHIGPEKPYLHKPPLPLWIHGLALNFFGANLIAARLPSILAAAAVIVFSMLALRNLGTRREAITSGIVLALTYEFFRRTREISLDLWQLLFIMAAVWLITIAIRRKRVRPVVLCGVPLGLALLCKPLVALVTLPIFAIWLALTRRAALIQWLAFGALPIALFIAAPWHLYMYSVFGDTFTHQYFSRQIEKVAAKPPHTSVFYYLEENAATFWPWMLALIYACYLRFTRGSDRRPRRDLFLLGAIWVGVWLIVLSSFAERKPNYALPLYPMLAWICAWGICRIRWARLATWYERGLPGIAPTAAAVFVIAAFAPIRFQEPPEENWAAVIDWIKARKIDSAQLAHANLELNDLCYVYLKTGSWMKSLPLAESDPEWRNGNRLIVTKTRRGSDPLANQGQIVFSSGTVRVVSKVP